jgi:hypothetical protein
MMHHKLKVTKEMIWGTKQNLEEIKTEKKAELKPFLNPNTGMLASTFCHN